jgi:alginate O-acetyltransferase complex protein AlgI
MVFSSFLFLFFFLPACLGCYFVAPARWKNLVLLVWSYLFYAWGAPRLIGLFFISTVVDYVLGRAIAANRSQVQRQKLLLTVSLVFNLAALFYFKYANFFIGELEDLMRKHNLGGIHWVQVALPIGISFFTFHKISYIVDVYRGIVRPATNFINYALYIALFPQLIAGPIIRYHDIHEQISKRVHDIESVFSGLCRFCLGLGKKVLIADAMGSVANNVFHLQSSELSAPYAWLGIICYAYQIYFDFSGYSDMAIGLGKVMGFHFLENFDQPYISQNFTEFWRRWHISLSRWMRDYLYIPLGGNRVSKVRMYLNLWVVFFLSGLWHGANWTFIVWGLYHGFFLVIDRLFWLKLSLRLGRVINTLLTFVLVLVGWVLFRSDTLAQALTYLGHMFDVVHYWTLPRVVLRGTVIHNEGLFVFFVATLLCFVPLCPSWEAISRRLEEKLSTMQVAFVKFAASAACLILSALAIATTDYSPFIYFRF